MPSVVNRSGVREIVQMNMTADEQEKFHRSSAVIKEMLAEIEL